MTSTLTGFVTQSNFFNFNFSLSNFFNLSPFTRNDNLRTFFIVIILVGLRRSFIA